MRQRMTVGIRSPGRYQVAAAAILAIGGLSACYPGEISNVSETQVVLTTYNQEFDFAEVEWVKPHVKSIQSLSAWSLEHVKDFLEVHGYEDLDEVFVQAVHRLIDGGSTLVQALNLARAMQDPKTLEKLTSG